MKIIKINESQKNRLFEAYREGFSFDKLSLISNWRKRFEYCTKWLGESISKGSSRCIFSLSDNMVLKLAYGNRYEAGVDQNMAEFNIYKKSNSPLLARIYKVDNNFTYLVSENVIPATEEDFEKFLGIPFYHAYYQNTIKRKDKSSKYNGDLEVGYNKYFKNLKRPFEVSSLSMTDILDYIEAKYTINEPYYDKIVERTIKNSIWLKEFLKLVRTTNITDYGSIENFGIVNRDGNPMIVLLDSGLNLDIWEKYYDDI